MELIITVIAWDTKILAADSRVTYNGSTLLSDNCHKLHRLTLPKRQEFVAGICGVLGLSVPWMADLTKNGFGPLNFPDPNNDYGMTGLFVSRKGRCISSNTKGLTHDVEFPCAEGSGSEIANHFLRSGSDAITAIKEACKTELTCGGPIIAYNFATDTFTRYEQ